MIGTLQLLAACERTETLERVVVRGLRGDLRMRGGVAALLHRGDGGRRCRFAPASSVTSRSSRRTSRTSPAATPPRLLHAPLPARDRPRLDTPAGSLSQPAGGPDPARLRPPPPAAPCRRRHRRARGRGSESGPRRGQRRSLRRDLAEPHPPPRAAARPCRSPIRSSARRWSGSARRLGAGPLYGDGVRLLRFGRGVDNRRLREEIGYEPRFDAEGAVRDFAAKTRGRRIGPVPASGRSAPDRLAGAPR